jgi:hypothetical protein
VFHAVLINDLCVTLRPKQPKKNMSNPKSKRLTAAMLLSVSSVPIAAIAQYGVTPSLNGMFFDDFRARALDIERPSDGATTPSYRFHRGYYRTQGPQGTRRSVGEDPYATGEESVDYYSHSQRYGREFGRYSGTAVNRGQFFAPAYSGDPYSGGDYNLKLGNVPIRLSLGATAEYNDNVTRRSSNELEEYILGFDVGLNASYSVTRYNRLSLSAGFGIDHYFNHPEVNPYSDERFSLAVSDGSNISFDILLGDILFTVYDRFSIGRLASDDFALDDLDLFSAFTNDVGVAAYWGINSSTAMTVNFNRQDQIPIDDEYDELQRSTNTISTSLSWSPSGTWVAGLNGGTSWVDYDESVQNDADTYNVGVFLSSPITRNTSIRAGFGSQIFDFDEGGANQDRSDLDDYYYNVALQNQLNARISHSLTFGHESSLGTRSNFVTTDYVRYGVGVVGYRGSRFSVSAFYEEEESSGGLTQENFDRYGIDAYWGHQLTNWIHAGLGYNYGNVDSSIEARDYVQHSFSIDTSYPITPNMVAGLGYRFWTTDADGEDNDFDQNRIVLNLRYNF